MAKGKFAVSGLELIGWLNIVAAAHNLYYRAVENISEILNKSVEWSDSGAVKTAFRRATLLLPPTVVTSWLQAANPPRSL